MSNFSVFFGVCWGRQAFKLKNNAPSGLKENYLIQKGWIFYLRFSVFLKGEGGVFEGGGGLVKCYWGCL